jgi:hypothetical protein
MRCPVCKAENDKGPQCRRCKVDLSLLFAVEEHRGRLLTAARHALVRGEWRQGVQEAAEADWLRSDDDSRHLLAVAHLLNRDYAAAWQCYRSGTARVQHQGEAR